MRAHEMPLSHYSRRPFVFDYNHVYTRPYARHDKPMGFWVTVDGEHDWPTWCHDEGFAIEHLNYKHVVSLRDDANVLVLTSYAELVEFSERYPKLPTGEYAGYFFAQERFWGIDWEAVQREYDGIVISPYIWEARFDIHWYYSWDVASGVIWNLGAIDSLSLVSETNKTH